MAGNVSAKVSTDEVIAYRLNAHHLTYRVAGDQLLDVAGRSGVQNSPPGSALLALHARVRELSAEHVNAAVAEDKTLLQSWCMRGAPFFFPTQDASVFTTGVLPPTEAAMGHFLPGLEQAIAKLDLSLTEVVALCGTEINPVLSGRQLAIRELGEELATRIGPQLTPSQRRTWEAEGPYAPDQQLGEGVVHFCIRILTLQQVVCFAPRAGNTAPFVLVDDWLGQPTPELTPEVARAELLRRYLHCYGPSTRANFAAWLGVNTGDAGHWWDLVQDELTPVDFDGRSWMLTDDLVALRSAPQPEGVRLLPPRDPYTQMCDRETIVDRKHHRDLWKANGAPGAVLVDGKIVGIWRSRKNGRRLTTTIGTIGTFGTLRASDEALLRDEAEQVAMLRGATSTQVLFQTP